MKMPRPAILLVALVLALAGCGGGGSNGGNATEPEEASAPDVTAPEGQLNVAQAKQQGGSGITVYGIVYRRLEEWMLCQSLDETIYPAGCVDPTLKVANPDALKDVKLEEGIGQGGGLYWTTKPVAVTGDVQDDTITVTSVEQS